MELRMISTSSTDGSGAISTLLVANRGEIALRVIRAAHELGLRTVAVYSDADREAPHVRAADVAVRIGPTPASESYLCIDAILEAARSTDADAVHPGYGFLSERAPFARAVTEAGLTFVGPSAEVMDRMGRKDLAREVAIAAGVPVVPSAELRGDEVDASHVGYPLLVKAAAGGGGKCMRIVREPAAFADALAAARREALSAFGDDTILVERYVEHGRHVEVQVLADHHGHVVHLFERDCSAQRRHQKVIEEAPAPTISPEVRRVLTESAVALAKQVGYTNAGTVEFLVDQSTAEQGVYFLEMNTRLQVEHPVTELVTGLDLVQLQLRIAAGEPLPFTQDEVTCTGHAFEARVYAEDAFNGFLPQAGVAESVRWSPRARVDAALESGQVVSTSYDPMLGKVIVHGPTREAARRALVTALDDTAIVGLTTNLGFLRGLADSQEFRDNEIDTAWLDAHPDAIRPRGHEQAAVLAAWALATNQAQDRTPFGTGDGWRLAGPAAHTPVALWVDGEQRLFRVGRDQVSAASPAGASTASTAWGGSDGNERTWQVHPIASDAGVLRLEIDDRVHEAAVRIGPHRVEVAYLGHTFAFDRPDAFGPAAAAGTSDGSVVAPMPGTVLSVSVAEGQPVEEGDVLGVMEAMKMELSLKAPVSGTVATVGARSGEQVALGATLFVVQPRPVGDPATKPTDEE
jgi:acetyl-CoA/propionyl-CoA carboxylase, biotin carboxylase, biotin carboxyl carrier protein